MTFDAASIGGKRYGDISNKQIHLSPGSFQKSSENRKRTEKKWNQQHSRIFIKKSTHETWKTGRIALV